MQEGDPDEAKRRSEGAISPLKRSNFFSPTFCKIVFCTFPKKYKNKKWYLGLQLRLSLWYTSQVMPLLKSSKKKMRRDKRRTEQNDLKKQVMKSLVKTMRRMPDADNLKQVSSNLDKAAKTKLIHPNKASRLKSRLSKLMSSAVATK